MGNSMPWIKLREVRAHASAACRQIIRSLFTSAEFLSASYVMVIFDLQIDPGLWLTHDSAMGPGWSQCIVASVGV